MIQASLLFDNSLPTGGSKIPVGIHSKVMFMGVVQDGSYVDINFQNDSGQQIHKRLFTPDGSRPKEGESAAEAIERQQTNNLKHLVHMLRVVYGDDAVQSIEAPTYDKFIEKCVTLLNPKKGFLVNLKVVFDRSGKWPDLGFFPSSYVEAFTEGKEVSLKFTKTEQEAINTNSGEKKADDDLPF